MKTYSSREVLKILHDDGWSEIEQRGSHVQLVHPTKAGKATVPHPRKTLKPKTLHSIFKQAGITRPE
jgi:predicted RNA binding protein YcfA (HicA-like mRNA interferase family)